MIIVCWHDDDESKTELDPPDASIPVHVTRADWYTDDAGDTTVQIGWKRVTTS